MTELTLNVDRLNEIIDKLSKLAVEYDLDLKITETEIIIDFVSMCRKNTKLESGKKSVWI